MKRLVIVLLLLVVATPAWSARARQKPPEPPPPLTEGARVRVTLLAKDSRKVIGSVLALSRDSLVVSPATDTPPRPIARLDVKKLELSRGMKSDAGRGAGIGALIGAVLIASIGASAVGVEGTSNDVAIVAMAGAFVGAVGGAGVGALIGSTSHSERWVKVPPR